MVADRADELMDVDAYLGEREIVREQHLHAERNVSRLGTLAIAVGVWWLVFGVFELVQSDLLAGLVEAAIGALVIVAGAMVRILHPMGRIGLSVLWVLYVGLALRSVGLPTEATTETIVAAIHVLFVLVSLWVLWNDKARMVFSDHYRHSVVSAAPAVHESP